MIDYVFLVMNMLIVGMLVMHSMKLDRKIHELYSEIELHRKLKRIALHDGEHDDYDLELWKVLEDED